MLTHVNNVSNFYQCYLTKFKKKKYTKKTKK